MLNPMQTLCKPYVNSMIPASRRWDHRGVTPFPGGSGYGSLAKNRVEALRMGRRARQGVPFVPVPASWRRNARGSGDAEAPGLVLV